MFHERCRQADTKPWENVFPPVGIDNGCKFNAGVVDNSYQCATDAVDNDDAT